MPVEFDDFAFLEGSADIYYCRVCPNGVVLRASLAIRTMAGRDPTGGLFTSLQAVRSWGVRTEHPQQGP